MKKQFRDFESAREFARSLGLKGTKEWYAYCTSGNKPDDIPSAPEKVFKNDFKGYGDFLGSGTIASFNKQFRPFKEAREFVRKLNLKGQREWREYCASGNKPDDIASNPNATYKNKGWISWGDFLGSGTIAAQLKVYRPYKEAREFVRKLKLKNYKEWQEYCASGNKPDDIPSNFPLVYKNNGWVSWSNVLNTGTIQTQQRVFRPFKEAREFVRNLGLTSIKYWREYVKSGNKPDDIPNAPGHTYKKEGWISWGDFLDTGTVATQDRVYRPFKEAREFVRSLGLKNHKEWQEYCASGNKPDDIPNTPWDVYKEWNKK